MEPDLVITTVAETLSIPRESIRNDSKLIELAKDSIALFKLLLSFEKLLGRNVNYEDVAEIETVGDIIAYIDSLPDAGSAAAV
jgi:acyl carrier protein